jgi:hypothetical protein
MQETLKWEEMKASSLTNRHASQIHGHQLEKKIEARISEVTTCIHFFFSNLTKDRCTG